MGFCDSGMDLGIGRSVGDDKFFSFVCFFYLGFRESEVDIGVGGRMFIIVGSCIIYKFLVGFGKCLL